MPPTLAQIEQMIADLLPQENGQPDIDGTAVSPDVAQIVAQTTETSPSADLQAFFKRRSIAEGWRELAVLLARALLMIDKEHRAIIKAIRSA